MRRIEFQSTRPRGARQHGHRQRCGRGMGFNPRARAGRDSGAPTVAEPAKVSIHAPARGATGLAIRSNRLPICFNPRARAGRDTEDAKYSTPPARVSIHAPARGATWRLPVRRQ